MNRQKKVSVGQARASGAPLSTVVLAQVMKTEKSIAGGQRSYLRAKLSILPEVCPRDEENPRDCPLDAARKADIEKRMAWFDGLNEEAILNIYTYCRLCLESKDKLG